MANARLTALSALIAERRQGAWSDGVLKDYIARDRLDRRDAALASRLCYGVMQNRTYLDWALSGLVSIRLRDVQPVVLDILRLGAYQILFMERVPDSAAVNEAVEQCKTYANRKASGFVNGVLRSLSRQKAELGEPAELSVRYSHPQELVDLLTDSIGRDEVEAFLAADNTPCPTVLQLNPLFSDAEKTMRELTESEAELTPHPWLEGCFLAQGTGNLEQMPAFREGRIYVQDAAARLAAMASGVKPGMTVLDACAAPGGKSFAAAMQMENRGSILSCDIHPHKLRLIENGAARLGITIISASVHNAQEYAPEWENKMDAVIADVPCSGLGVIRKKPDIRYKDLKPIEKLPPLQLSILDTVCRYVRPGGVLVYSTCTVLKRENEEVAQAFLQRHPEFSVEPIEPPEGLTLKDCGMVTLLPHLHDTDGFFICKMRKQHEN